MSRKALQRLEVLAAALAVKNCDLPDRRSPPWSALGIHAMPQMQSAPGAVLAAAWTGCAPHLAGTTNRAKDEQLLHRLCGGRGRRRGRHVLNHAARHHQDADAAQNLLLTLWLRPSDRCGVTASRASTRDSGPSCCRRRARRPSASSCTRIFAAPSTRAAPTAPPRPPSGRWSAGWVRACARPSSGRRRPSKGAAAGDRRDGHGRRRLDLRHDGRPRAGHWRPLCRSAATALRQASSTAIRFMTLAHIKQIVCTTFGCALCEKQ